MKSIVQEGDPVLRSIANPVPENLFNTPELKELIADMEEVLDAEPDGVALAAPQINVPYRLFIVRKDRTLPTPITDVENAPSRPPEVDIYINPEIVKRSRKKQESDEGCLSVRGMYGKTKRHERATIRAQGIDGKRFERGAGGLMAQIFEHEIDHLNGILFIDHATDLIHLKHSNEQPEI